MAAPSGVKSLTCRSPLDICCRGTQSPAKNIIGKNSSVPSPCAIRVVVATDGDQRPQREHRGRRQSQREHEPEALGRQADVEREPADDRDHATSAMTTHAS